MSKQYLFRFRPLDSFSFSGESSARAKEGGSDTFFANAPNAARRQSFRVETDRMPPQTTVMGAVRRMLYGRMDIGPGSFSLARSDAQHMGDIEAISPVFLMGKDKTGKSVLCIPAPQCVPAGPDGCCVPVTRESYRAKDGTQKGFLLYPADNLSAAPTWMDADKFTRVYTQPVIHIGDQSRTDSYHLQRKCRFTRDVLTDLAFCTIVTLGKDIAPGVQPMLLSLGSKDSRFHGDFQPTRLSLDQLRYAPDVPASAPCWCMSLLSAALLPEGWRDTEGLIQAFVEKRDMRCAVTVSDSFALQLIPEKLVLADSGSTFLFSSRDARDHFARQIKADNRRVCGLNQVLCYDLNAAQDT